MPSEDKMLMQKLKDHIEKDDRIFEEISNDIRTIKENHLTHIEKDMAINTTDTAWIKKAVIGGLGVTFTTLISVVLILIQMLKN